MRSAVKRCSKRRRTRWRSKCSTSCTARAALSMSPTMNPSRPGRRLPARSRSHRRRRACRRPSPRSSPVRTAPASRSGTAGRGRCRGTRPSGARRSRRRTRRAVAASIGSIAAASMSRSTRSTFAAILSGIPRAPRSRSHGRAPSPARCGRGTRGSRPAAGPRTGAGCAAARAGRCPPSCTVRHRLALRMRDRNQGTSPNIAKQRLGPAGRAGRATSSLFGRQTRRRRGSAANQCGNATRRNRPRGGVPPLRGRYGAAVHPARCRRAAGRGPNSRRAVRVYANPRSRTA